MSEGSAGLHEPAAQLSGALIDRHRALQSIIEELEAVDWYAQRVEAASDPDLASVLAHNGNEEKEHAAMTIEWLRRNDDVFDRHLRTYLFTEGPIVALEATAEGNANASSDGSLGLGQLESGVTR